jgi:hypothetical protein
MIYARTICTAWVATFISALAPAVPITASIPEGKENATFTNALHPGNRIGYRFHEHTPITSGEVPTSTSNPGSAPQDVARFVDEFAKRPNVLVKTRPIDEKEWTPQKWTYYLAPTVDGIDMLWIVETFDEGLEEYYGVQQCFRLGGKSNQEWRRQFAETPAFSEYDLWDVTQKDSKDKTSLSYVLRAGKWEALPAVRESVGARTPLGVTIDTTRSNNKLESMLRVGPYDAEMLAPIDIGLITRTDIDKTWVCGIFWEGTSHVTDHHPADCLHTIVNVGGVPAHSKRAIRGKIYWFKGSLDELQARCKKDFPNG